MINGAPVDSTGAPILRTEPDWTPPTAAEFVARQRAQQDAEADARLAKGIAGERG